MKLEMGLNPELTLEKLWEALKVAFQEHQMCSSFVCPNYVW